MVSTKHCPECDSDQVYADTHEDRQFWDHRSGEWRALGGVHDLTRARCDDCGWHDTVSELITRES